MRRILTFLASGVLVIGLSVAAFLFHKGQTIEQHESALVFLSAFFAILLVGPGRISVDGMMGK